MLRCLIGAPAVDAPSTWHSAWASLRAASGGGVRNDNSDAGRAPMRRDQGPIQQGRHALIDGRRAWPVMRPFCLSACPEA